FQCIPGSGSLTRSAVNQQAGAVSQWSGVFSAIAVALMVLVLAPLAQFIPYSSLAGLLMLAAYRMVDRNQLAFHLQATRLDAGVVLATALAAVVISVEFCIVIGVFLSFVLYVPRAAQVRMIQLTLTLQQRIRERMAGDPPCDRILYFGLEGDLFFGAEPELEKHFGVIEQSAQAISGHGEVRVVILVLSRARNPDAAFLKLLDAFQAKLRSRNIVLLMAGVQPDLSRALTTTGMDVRVGAPHIFRDPQRNSSQEVPATPHTAQGSSIWDAIRFAYGLLGDDLCSSCPRRKGPTTTDQTVDYVI